MQGNIASHQTVNVTQEQHDAIIVILRELKTVIESSGHLDTEKKEELTDEVNLAEIESKAKKLK